MKLKAKDIAEALGARLIGDPERTFEYFSFDSRKMQKDGLFFALKGKRDGHDFASHAVEMGAAGVVCERELNLPVVQFLVRDTGEALRRLAAFTLKIGETERVGITGSAGKTTTKEFLFKLLEGDYKVERTPGNWNNLIGVPVFLLNRKEDSEILVIEMGISQPGEMDLLVEVAKPQVSLFTRIYEVHTEFLKDVNTIAEEKAKILRYSEKASFNLDDPHQRKIYSGFSGRKVFYSGSNPDAEVRLASWKRLGVSRLGVEIHYGDQLLKANFHFWNPVFLENLLAALSATRFFSVSKLEEKIASLKPVKGRGTVWEKGGITFIDESYNSNPSALLRSLIALSSLEGRKLAVLSDMLELGEKEKEKHREVGRKIADLKIDLFLLTGPLMRETAEELARKRSNVFWFEDRWELNEFLKNQMKEGDVVFFKGSNGTKLWEVAERWS